FAGAALAACAVAAGDTGMRRRVAMAAAVFALVLAVPAARNWLVDGSVLGLHGSQWSFSLARGWLLARGLVPFFRSCMPASLLALLALRHSTEARALAAAAFAALALVPFFVPNFGGSQIGPRYLVFLAPVFAACAAAGLAGARVAVAAL